MEQPGSRVRPPAGGPVGRWLRFGIGLLLLGGGVALLVALPAPGPVLRHNAEQEIQATALFYMDLDRMPEIEGRLESMLEEKGRP